MALVGKSRVLMLTIGNLFLCSRSLVFDGAQYQANIVNVSTECI